MNNTTPSLVNKMIDHLKQLRKSEVESVVNITNFELLITSLEELDSLVGMHGIKASILSQLKFLIVKQMLVSRYGQSIFDEHMLNTVITGPPGVGKTRICNILAKFWYAVGSITASESPTNPKIYFAQRNDFVAGYQGQTAIKTKKLLESCRGGVLVIDEAYALIHNEKDIYGREALTIINTFMSENPSDIIIIFCGYYDQLQGSLFKCQPGLERRCTWIFKINGYNATELAAIFKHQLYKTGWSLAEAVDIEKFFQLHKHLFTSFGGDTERFSFYCKLVHSEHLFDNQFAQPSTLISSETLALALLKYKEQHILVPTPTQLSYIS